MSEEVRLTGGESVLLDELRAIRDRLEGIESQLRYQGQRFTAMDQRMARLVETVLKPPSPGTPAFDKDGFALFIDSLLAAMPP